MVEIGLSLEFAASGRRGTVTSFLGEGSQGSVYAVSVVPGGELALKWYHRSTATNHQRQALAELVERGAPSGRFLWPIEMVEGIDGSSSFGYLMPLRPAEYVGIDRMLRGKVPTRYSTITTLCLELADAFLSLHAQGLCYRDISFGNLFFDPATGTPLICDNDNIGIDGRDNSAVLGTLRFMAPEIVRGEAGPSTRTDLYSLAVLLFYVLMVGHPLVGRRQLEYPYWDSASEEDLFGRRPLFVFDPDDSSNFPIPDEHASVILNWDIYPAYVRDLFVKAFTRGLIDPGNGRVRESVWRAAMARLRDSIVRCPSCGRENLFDQDRPRRACWSCQHAIEPPLRLDLGGQYLVLNEDTRLFRHHLVRDYDFTRALAEVARHPERPDVWGLRNCSDHAWTVRLDGGERRPVEPGRSVSLVPGTTITLREGEVRLVL